MPWLDKTLGALCDLGGGEVKTGPFGAQLHQSDYSDEGIPVVMPTDIINGAIGTSRIARVSEAQVVFINLCHFPRLRLTGDDQCPPPKSNLT
jgi:type I restriction enzyme S subunit